MNTNYQLDVRKLQRDVEREDRKRKALQEHARLARLFREDRLAFEREKRRMVREVIDSASSEEQRLKLQAIQESWDRRMRGAKLPENRLVLAKHFFFEHIRTMWRPLLEQQDRS